MSFKMFSLRALARAAMCAVGLATTVAGTAALAQTAAAPAAKPPIADFFRPAEMRRALLSPDGRFFAAIMQVKAGQTVLAVVELDNPKNIKAVGGFADAGIGTFAWVGNERLVYTATKDEEGKGRDLHSEGLWSVRRDGSDSRVLIQSLYGADDTTGTRVASRALPYEWELAGVPDDDSGEVLVMTGRFDAKNQLRSVRLSRLNIESQTRRSLDGGAPLNTIAWQTDGRGEAWALQTRQKDQVTVYLKNEAGEWKPWQSGNLVEAPPQPFASDPSGLRLIEARTPEGTTALYRLDPKTLQVEKQPLISAKGFDFIGRPVSEHNTGRLIGIHFTTDAPGSVWFDPTLKAMQAAVDKKLPGRVNMIQCSDCLKSGRVLVTSSADVLPAEYYVYDHNKNQFSLLGAQRPWIDPAAMGRRDQVRIKTRDGLEMPVLVTLPRGKAAGPRPAVMLVHGGPNVRGTEWTWGAEAQFLASRGYVVIEPEFRGSMGYGFSWFQAGWKQWGLAMQDDVTDALKWAVGKGWVDAKRVCIAGASYGGYATLMGLIKDPDLYQCGVSWVGVTDLDYLFTINWSDASDAAKEYGMPVLIGDPQKDAEQFRRTSPLRRAAELKKPLLLGYGASDVRVPLTHGRDFRAAVEAGGNKNVEYVVYSDEGHIWTKLSTLEDFYGRMERFLARHIGTEPSAAGATPPATTGQ